MKTTQWAPKLVFDAEIGPKNILLLISGMARLIMRRLYWLVLSKPYVILSFSTWLKNMAVFSSARFLESLSIQRKPTLKQFRRGRWQYRINPIKDTRSPREKSALTLYVPVCACTEKIKENISAVRPRNCLTLEGVFVKNWLRHLASQYRMGAGGSAERELQVSFYKSLIQHLKL